MLPDAATERRLTLRDLILVMREDVVDSPRVKVDLRTQVLGRHR